MFCSIKRKNWKKKKHHGGIKSAIGGIQHQLRNPMMMTKVKTDDRESMRIDDFNLDEQSKHTLTSEEKSRFYQAIGYKDDKPSDQVDYPEDVRSFINSFNFNSLILCLVYRYQSCITIKSSRSQYLVLFRSK